jgi:hypothetical protein
MSVLVLGLGLLGGCGEATAGGGTGGTAGTGGMAGTGGSGGTGGMAGIGGSGGSGGTGGAGGMGGIDFDAWPCTEQGIRDAIAFGGGPHTFACDGPTVVTTQAAIDIDNDVILDGEGALIVDGDLSHQVFRIGRLAVVTLRDLTVTRGYASFAGAAIYNNQGDLTIESCRLVRNESDDIAAGIYSFDGALRVFDSEISDNASAGGAAIFVGSDAILEDSTVSGNAGGGVYSALAITVRGCTIAGNTANFGGGGLGNSGDAFVVRSTISGNSAATYGGGVVNSGRLALYSTTIEGNIADQGGGLAGGDGIRNVEGVDFDFDVAPIGLVDIRYSTIANNSARLGGGIYAEMLRMTVGNSTISGNMAEEDGGGVYITGTSLGASTAYFASNTLVESTASSGGAIFATDESVTVRLSGNIIEGSCNAVDGGATWSSEGNNLESPGDSCGLGFPSDLINRTEEDLDLGPLADNGGETATHLPLPSSVAIDAIPAETCRESLPIVPLIDQRAIQRPQGSGCDIGAVEVEP